MTTKTNRALRALALDEHNARVRAEHAALVEAILVARPSWSRAALLAVGKSYGPKDEPGLCDILEACIAADALAGRFGVSS